LGLDDGLVGKYIEDRYRSQSGEDIVSGREFLHKLVNWSLELPRVRAGTVSDYYFKGAPPSVLDLLSQLDALPYRFWLRISNRFQQYKERMDDLPAIVFAVVEECFPALERELRMLPRVKSMLEEEIRSLGELGKRSLPPEWQFLIETEKLKGGIFGDRGPEVWTRIRAFLAA